jgi:hypothetical protein
MSIGSPVSGDAAVVGGAGTSGRVVETVGAAATLACGFDAVVVVVVLVVVVVVAGAARVVVVVDLGRVVVDVDVVVVGAGLIVSTRRRSVPQALPTTRSTPASASLRRGPRWLCGWSRVMSNRTVPVPDPEAVDLRQMPQTRRGPTGPPA